MQYEIVDINNGTVKHTGIAEDFDGVVAASIKEAKRLGLSQYTLRFISAAGESAKHILYGPSQCNFRD